MPPQPFSCEINHAPLPMRGKTRQTDSGSSSDLCLRRGTCLPSRNDPMTDFRQRQALSTLTAPAAWGIAPRSLVQPRNPSRLRSHQNRYSLFMAAGIPKPAITFTIAEICGCCQPLCVREKRIFVFYTTTIPVFYTVLHLENPASLCYITVRKGDTNVQVKPKVPK